MFFLQINNPESPVSLVLFFGTVGMLALTIGLIVFIIFHQRKVIRYQLRLQRLEQEQQKMLLNASIRLQEEERQRIAADHVWHAQQINRLSYRPYLHFFS